MNPTEPSHGDPSSTPTQRIAPRAEPATDVGPGPRAENEARLGRRVGPYRLQGLLGHGGMGAVYLARRDDGEFEREVALKLIRIGGEDELSRRRFERERRILSRFEHPAIARLYDGGVDDESGAPWFAMERIDGENLTVWCAHRRLPLRERVRLVVAIGHAVQYAHQQLVIHRDLKPSNILVDRDGAPHVLDFGIAAMLDEAEADRTSPRTMIHTPEYAAPEQIDGAPIGAATDVYTLGVILFELLVGVRPFDDGEASVYAVQRAVLETPAPPLANRLPLDEDARERGAAERQTTVAHWRRTLRSDLDAIVRTALEKRPADRYPTMSALVDDLQHWLDGRPVRAARAGWLYRSGKFVRRHRVGLALLAGVFSLLSAATALSLYQARKARVEAERAEVSKQFIMSLFQQARPGSDGDQVSAQQLLDEGRARLEHEMGDQPRLAGELLNTIGNAYAHLGDYAQARAQLERALLQLPAAGETLRPRLDVLVDLVDLLSHQGKGDDGDRYADEALAIVARLRAGEGRGALAWLEPARPPTYFGDAAQTLESRAEDLALARARLLDRRGERDAAIELRRAVADARDARPGEHPTRIRTAQNDLALALNEAGRSPEAIARFERLLRDNEAEFGPDHVGSITVRHNLALALRRTERLDDAERIERGNAALAARELPATHPMQAYIANTMASILRQRGRWAEAQRWYAQARAVFDAQPDADRDMLGTIDYNDAVNRVSLHDADGAERALASADAIWNASFGSPHPRRALIVLQRLAIALQRGDAAAAHAQLAAFDTLFVPPAKPDARERARHALLASQLARLEDDPARAAALLDAAWDAVEEGWAPPQADHTIVLLARAQLALDLDDLAGAQQRLATATEQQAARGAAATGELHLLDARLACVRGDYARCRTLALAADARHGENLGAATTPRRLARAWAAAADACARPDDVQARERRQRAFEALPTATMERDRAALQRACAATR